jgi:hypothetical protein
MWRIVYVILLFFFLFAIEIAEWIPRSIGYIVVFINLMTIAILGRKSDN